MSREDSLQGNRAIPLCGTPWEKGGGMKKRALSSLAGLGLALVLAAASYAQMTHRVEARIPFEFAVSGKVLPDGAYFVTRATSGYLKIESLDGSNAVLALALYAQSNTAATEAKLVFDRVGNHYFLRQMWEPGNDTGVEIPRCKMESELIKRSLASNSPKDQHPAGPELVYVPGRGL